MSNEYKDWLADLSEEQRANYQLYMKYPFFFTLKKILMIIVIFLLLFQNGVNNLTDQKNIFTRRVHRGIKLCYID